METHNTGKSLIKKIAIVGPESTGKSTLSQFLAEHYNSIWVNEFARNYIDKLERPYNKEDLGIIARKQVELEDSLVEEANKFLFCDTTLIVIKIWSMHKYGNCDEWILNEINSRKYDLTLLTKPDFPWIEDPQREHPHMRNYFFDVYKEELKSYDIPYSIISGDIKSRMNQAISEVNALI